MVKMLGESEAKGNVGGQKVVRGFRSVRAGGVRFQAILPGEAVSGGEMGPEPPVAEPLA